MSPDGRRALLIARTRASGSDTDAQARAIAAARRAFASAQLAAGGPAAAAQLVMTGPGVFSAEARAMIEGDVKRLSLLGTALIAAILLAVFRSPVVLALGLAPVATGALAGIAAVSLGHGVVHGMTLGFGMTLIGEAVDYSIYLFLQAGRDGAAGDDLDRRVLADHPARRGHLHRRLLGPAPLGAAGLVATRPVLHRRARGRRRGDAIHPARLAARGIPGARRLRHRRTPSRRLRLRAPPARGGAVLAIAAVAVLATRAGALWDPDLASLNPIPEAHQGSSTRELRGAPGRAGCADHGGGHGADGGRGPRRRGNRGPPTRPARDRRNAVRLRKSPPASCRASPRSRRAARACRDAATLRARLALALADLPLRPEKLEPFVADVEKARAQSPLTREAFAGTTLDLALDGLLFASASGQWTAMIALRSAVREGGARGIDAAAVRAAVSSANVPGAITIDLKAEADRLYAGYLDQAQALSAAGVAVIAVLLGRCPAQRPARRPDPRTPGCGGRRRGRWDALAGTRLTIPHLIGLVLIVAIGSNYALFFDRVAVRPDAQALRTLASLGIANLTTVAGFGILSLSSIPVLHAIGSTVALGTFLSLAFAAALARERPPDGAAA